jgi:hypothetical protein
MTHEALRSAQTFQLCFNALQYGFAVCSATPAPAAASALAVISGTLAMAVCLMLSTACIG